MTNTALPVSAIITIPPYAPYIREAARLPIISGVRVNTVMPIKETLPEMLERIRDLIYPKILWIDLKCRQLRVTNYASVPYQYIELSHPIELKLDAKNPPKAYFNDGLEYAQIARVDGRKLIMLDGPQRVIGPGESVNITDPSLVIHGYLTERDREYIEAAKGLGIHHYMISYLEEESDITTILELDPKAKIMAKIESVKGLEFIERIYPKYRKKFDVQLMAARGDLYVEIGMPHKILSAVLQIVRADPKACAASRIFSSLRNSLVPSCQDISDIGFLYEIGYREFLIGDDICFNRESLLDAINLLAAIFEDYIGARSAKP